MVGVRSMPLPARSYDRSLNAEIERLLYQVDVLLQDADGLVFGLSDRQFNWRSSPESWSIAECLDHLNTANARFAMEYKRAISEGKEKKVLGDGPYVYGFFARWFMKIMEPPVKRRFRAPANMRPASGKSLDAVMAEWKRLQAEFKDLLRDASGLDLKKIKVTSPATNWIKYSLGAGFWIRTAHDRRHLWQARNVRNNPAFPAN